MDSKNVLKVEVNAENGVCVIRDEKGEVLLTKKDEHYYDKDYIKKRRADLKAATRGRIPDEKITYVDFLVYDALTEYDSSQEKPTDYSKRYLETVTDQIIYLSPASDEPILDKLIRKVTGRALETEATYLKRVRETKTLNLSKTGLSISYGDISAILASKELSMSEKMVALDIVRRQAKYNGIKTGELIEVPVVGEDDIPDLPKDFKPQQSAEQTEQKVAEEQAAQQEEPAPEEKPKGKEAEGDKPKEEPKAEAPRVEKISKPKAKQNTPSKKYKKRKIDKIKEGREELSKRRQAGKPKKADRPEGAPAPKRETKKERKARLSREGQEQRKVAEAKKPEAPKTKTASKQEVDEPKKTIVRPTKPESLKVRFTRKLKDARDSIREKIYKPHKNLINICGYVAIAGLVLLAGFKGYQYVNSNNLSDMVSETTSIVETIKDDKVNEGGEITVKPSAEVGSNIGGASSLEAERKEFDQTGTHTFSQISASPAEVGAEGNTTDSTQTGTTASVDQDRIDYLSSVRIGSVMSIDRGAYYEKPNDTGNYGYFENYTDYKKVLSKIGIITESGYTSIGVSTWEELDNLDDSKYDEIRNINLYELKQQYPDAQFTFHYLAEHKDDSEKPKGERRRAILGWLTETSAQKTIDDNTIYIEMEDLER